MKTILLVFGTRPEAIKMAPLVKKLQSEPEQFKTVVAVTGQHRQMLDQVLRIFDIVPDELAEVAVFLMSDASKCVSGEIFPCNQANHYK